MKLINSEDLFIFNLLSSDETLQLIEFLKLYADMCADGHDPGFIELIENERVRSAFTYFNNRFARRRPRKAAQTRQAEPDTDIEMVKSPSCDAEAEISQALSDSRISLCEALNVHCPAVASRYKPKNKEYNLMRANPRLAASIILELERSGFTGSAGNYIVSRLSAQKALCG